MPQIANIVVKNASNVDVTFTTQAGSTSDKQPAVYQNVASSAVRSNRQKVEIEAHDNGNGTSRVTTVNVRIPYVQTVDGVEKIVDYQSYKLVSSQPKRIPENLLVDGSAVACNIFAHAQVKSTLAEGIAPRG